jgi:hypothetical protein
MFPKRNIQIVMGVAELLSQAWHSVGCDHHDGGYCLTVSSQRSGCEHCSFLATDTDQLRAYSCGVCMSSVTS